MKQTIYMLVGIMIAAGLWGIGVIVASSSLCDFMERHRIHQLWLLVLVVIGFSFLAIPFVTIQIGSEREIKRIENGEPTIYGSLTPE